MLHEPLKSLKSRSSIALKCSFYNRQRLYSSNGYLSPVAFEDMFKAAETSPELLLNSMDIYCYSFMIIHLI